MAVDADTRALMRRLAEAVRVRRDELGETQQVVAERGGIDYRVLQLVESGRRNITLATLLRVARGLDLAPSELLARVEAMPDPGDLVRQPGRPPRPAASS